jgi:hypothetical protein
MTITKSVERVISIYTPKVLTKVNTMVRKIESPTMKFLVILMALLPTLAAADSIQSICTGLKSGLNCDATLSIPKFPEIETCDQQSFTVSNNTARNASYFMYLALILYPTD